MTKDIAARKNKYHPNVNDVTVTINNGGNSDLLPPLLIISYPLPGIRSKILGH